MKSDFNMPPGVSTASIPGNEPAKARKPRGPSKKNQAALREAYESGIDDARPPALGIMLIIALASGLGFGLGAWLF